MRKIREGRVLKVPLGAILLREGLLTAEQLEEALAEQKKTHEFLGRVLIRKGFLDEGKLMQVLSKQFNMRFVDLEGWPVDWEAALRFPSSLVIEHKLLPLRWDAKGLIVAMTNPLDAQAISEVHKAAPFEKVDFVLVTPRAMDKALGVYNLKLAERIKKLFEK